MWTAVAGVSGALAVGLGAYGSHALKEDLGRGRNGKHRAELWKQAQAYHLAHSAVLFAVPMLRMPYRNIAGACFTGGMAAFCGTLYASSYLGERPFPDLPTAPAGGVLLMCGWLSSALSKIPK